MQKDAVTAFSSVFKMPRFREVCTRPWMSWLMVCTPLGAQASRHSVLSVEAASMGSHAAAASSAVTVSIGSERRYSVRKQAAMRSAAALAFRPSSAATTASAATGMALSFNPPSADTSRSSVSAAMARSSRPSSILALARPLWISAPE